MAKRALVFLVVLLAAFRPAYAAGGPRALSGELAHHDAPRRQQWELLQVTLPPGVNSTAKVSLQDARGGPTISRPVSSAVNDPATGQSTLLLPLPYLAEAELPTGIWPILCTITGGDAVRLDVRRSGPTADRSTLRVIKPISASNQQVPSQLSRLPMIVTSVPDQEILTGPLLNFASTDAVLLTPQIAAKLSEERAANLMAAGVLLVLADNSSHAVPEKSPLSRFPWTRVTSSPSAGWITPAAALPRPAVIEPYLKDAPALRVQAVPSLPLKRNLLLVPLACIIVLILAKGLFRHPATILAVCAVAFTGIALLYVIYARTTAAPQPIVVQWRTATPEFSATNTGTMMLSESFTAIQPLFAYRAKATKDHATLLYPVFVSSDKYFAMKSARLDPTESTHRLDPGSHLEVDLRPRTASGTDPVLIYAARAATVEPTLAQQSITPNRGYWIAGGYAYDDPDLQHNLGILNQWAETRPADGDSLVAWFNIRGFAQEHRYFLLGQGPELTLLDLGPIPSPTTTTAP